MMGRERLSRPSSAPSKQREAIMQEKEKQVTLAISHKSVGRTRRVPGFLIHDLFSSLGSFETLRGLESWIQFWYGVRAAAKYSFPEWLLRYYCLQGLRISSDKTLSRFGRKYKPVFLNNPKKEVTLGVLLSYCTTRRRLSNVENKVRIRKNRPGIDVEMSGYCTSNSIARALVAASE